MSLSSRYL